MQNAKTMSAMNRDTVPKDVRRDTMDLPVSLRVLKIVKDQTVIDVQDIVSAVKQVPGAISVHLIVQCIVPGESVTKTMENAHRDANQDGMETLAIKLAVLGVQK